MITAYSCEINSTGEDTAGWGTMSLRWTAWRLCPGPGQARCPVTLPQWGSCAVPGAAGARGDPRGRAAWDGPALAQLKEGRTELQTQRDPSSSPGEGPPFAKRRGGTTCGIPVWKLCFKVMQNLDYFSKIEQVKGTLVAILLKVFQQFPLRQESTNSE